ncbi:hypothetical protein GJ698_06460 [Pseudoduganella sp. FT26W]|uniref:Transposase-like Mu C-terminal domain-containing protein n=1 Tax=Duganella aquatilis TaxID=2666082 RepID=A0A844D1T1_9BURK|nr:Mu transposase C-terminal domain-containing protein [Duganella aquatilis]MRW83735.1 hypothetical protein [Duganella aquatilis]
MLFKDDIYIDTDQQHYRVLAGDDGLDQAWVIAVDAPHAWPESRRWSLIFTRPLVPRNDDQAQLMENKSTAQAARAARALEAIKPLLAAAPSIYLPTQRARLVREHAALTGITERTLREYLREYWQGGQKETALYGNWHKSGRISESVSACRGAKPRHGDYSIFEVNASCTSKFEEACKWYLADDRRTITKSYRFLLRSHFARPDGNGNLFTNAKGDRPTLRQFDYYLRKNYPLEVRQRARKGDKEFEREHRAKLGSARFDCLGVGDVYEIDATIADIFLVSKDDRRRLVGKPTVYIIIDRRSGLIVGFYAGLENASWTAARLAILSIATDKAELCRQYGVAYDASDWPAHGIMPSQFYADRGEMISNASSRVVSGLNVTVANLPGLRPDWKPFVECGFKLMHQAIAEHAPGFDPASNFTKRRGKHYEKDASLTLEEFSRLMLEHVIAHNRRPKQALELSRDELMAEVIPAPIDLWNFSIQTRSGYLSRVAELDVRYALLPTAEAVVTEKGVLFQHCHYTCSEAVKKGWFVQARKRRFTVDISYDPRLTDAIYIRGSTDKKYHRADLTEPSKRLYGGLTFSEVQLYKKLEKQTQFDAEQVNQQVDLEFVQRITPTIENAKASLKRLPKTSRTARKADIKDDRVQALQTEREVTAAPLPYLRDGPPPEKAVLCQPGLHEVPPQEVNTPQGRLAAALAKQRNRIAKGSR